MPDQGWVEMHHPDNPGTKTAVVTAEAYDLDHSKKGWRLGPHPEAEKASDAETTEARDLVAKQAAEAENQKVVVPGGPGEAPQKAASTTTNKGGKA